MNLIVLGPPGAGKGTQAKLLANHFGLIHISSGQLLRQAATGSDPKAQKIAHLLKTGQLLPFDTVLELITNKIKNSPPGFVLDGTPRDLSQAEHLDWFFDQEKISSPKVIYYDLPDAVAQERLLKRARTENRSDDTPPTIQRRLEVYHQETESLIEYYRRRNQLTTIDARPSIETIFQATLEALR